ncbi:pilus assembly protein [Nocardioides panacis]|uniref:Pilus assembly protein n=1 Tax=Nocardioides panacis TaxID=2849501 RepID=A0A975SW28_9ACTN|nr:TadE family protein [Nocardioides panacis]QWZ06354.1 pilus assembly protein [Nocardioides panacis]
MKSVLSLRARIRARRRGQRGAVAVEAALVTTFILIPLIFGIIEFSFVLRDYVSVTSATRSGTRIASANAGAGVQICDPGETGTACADTRAPEFAKLAANAVQNQGSALNKDQINYMLIYKSNASGYPGTMTSWGSTPPATSCVTVGSCVVFKWVKASDKFKYDSGAWDSKTVNACVSGAESTGVYINATHGFLTGLFGSSMVIGDRTVMKFEPLTATSCGPGKHA